MTRVLKKQLVESLSRCRAAISSKPTAEILKNFCFRGATVSAFDGELGVVTGWPLLQDFCVPAARFFRVVDGLGEDPDLEVKDDKLFITAGGYRTQIATSSNASYPELIPQDLKPFLPESAEGVMAAAAQTIFSSDHKGEEKFAGVGFRGNYVYSTDGDRLTRVPISHEVSEETVVPGKAVRQMARFGEPTEFSISKGAMVTFFVETKTAVIAPLLAQRFPFQHIDDLLFRRVAPELGVEIPAGFLAAITRVRNLAPGREGSQLVLENTEAGLRVASSVSEVGESEEILPWDFKPSFRLTIRANYLADAVKRSDRMNFSDVISGKGTMLRFEGEDGFRHLVALMA